MSAGYYRRLIVLAGGNRVYGCVVKMGKALLDCWRFAGSAQFIGVIARAGAPLVPSQGNVGRTILKHFRPARRYN
jgi:hypothetical protein